MFQCFSTSVIWLNREHLKISRAAFGCHSWRVFLGSSGWRPGTLLSILQCTGQLPTTKNYPAPNINGAKVEINLVYSL